MGGNDALVASCGKSWHICVKKARFGLKPFHDAQRVLDGGMRGMRNVPQRVQKQDVEILQFCQGSLGDAAVIGQIRCADRSESRRSRFPHGSP